MCGCTSECFHRCPERMHRIVDAGAARIGLVLGQTGNGARMGQPDRSHAAET